MYSLEEGQCISLGGMVEVPCGHILIRVSNSNNDMSAICESKTEEGFKKCDEVLMGLEVLEE
ncbi:MAG: hypothetical protein KDC90_17965 [Ignavibacteriae bacterium]|nr:hypothetical protein [Ignavibacteriota bacterium]